MKRVEGTVEGVRRANLSRVLRLVHEDGPLSRAALTDATGLNRSTIGALVGDLSAAGLVQEGAPDLQRRVGRPSPNVSAAAGIVAVAINPEVDAVTVAAVALDRTVLVRERIEVPELTTTHRVASMAAECIERWRRDVLAGCRIVAAGIAVPGLVRAEDGLVRRAPHLDWTDAPLRDQVAEATGLPTAIDNDATLGALAESLYGAGRGVRDLVYVNGGASGIGGGLVIDGHLVRGAGGYAGELGQNRPGIANPADRRSPERGTVEDEVSRARLLAVLGLMSADEPTLEAAIRASSSVEAVAEVDRQRRILATALANAVNVLNPSVVVLGGFLATLLEQDPEGLLAAVGEQAMRTNAEQLQLRPAALGPDRLLVGAAEIAFETLLTDPLGVDQPDASGRADPLSAAEAVPSNRAP
ncbi:MULTISPECIES: ROK family transcriptional regulator [unclassified Microbacterium]|uniref:ROK family transcriptional regulator n=1 Tax=unclassified Microbacterium TaxID=2609290 RepID=UPI003018CFB4